MKNLSNILKELREQKGISMDKMCEDLSKLYGVSLAKSTISKWENGKAEPTLSYARILSKYFDVTLDYIIGISDSKDNFNIPEEYKERYKVAKKDIVQRDNVLEHAQAFMMDDKTDESDKEKLFEIVNKLYWESKAINKEKFKKNK